jgi:hypothetical protein
VAEHHRAADLHGIEHGDRVGHVALQGEGPGHRRRGQAALLIPDGPPPGQFRAEHVHVIGNGQDPELVIVEMRATATLTTTGQSFAATSIQVLRIREGQIVLFRDFANPRILEDAIGEPRPES